MAIIKELDQMDGLGIKALLDEKYVTVEEVTQHYIEKSKRLNNDLNAVIYPMYDEALEHAKKKSFMKGPFSGLPILIKELNDIKGYPSTQGSKLLEKYIAKSNDTIVNRLQNAGFIFLGKTNSPEFGFLPVTEPKLFGATKNPWNLTVSPGGSSGGAAVAVAAGLAPFAQGSDGGGSIRIPASACGLFGLKPSRGRVPYSDYFNQLSVNHVLTRSVRDSAALLEVLQGKGKFDTFPAFSENDSFLHFLNAEPKKLRIAVSPDWNGQTFVEDEVKRAIQHSAKLLEALGHEVEYVSPEFNFDQYAELFIKIWVGSGSVIVKHVAEMVGTTPSPENLEFLSYNLLKAGEKMTAIEYEEARVLLQTMARKILAFHEEFDVLVTPVLNKQSIRVGELANQTDPIHDMLDNLVNYCSFPSVANVTGQPSMSVPLYFSNEDMPIGTMMTGRIGDEALLLQLAKQLEDASPWMKHYGDLAGRLSEVEKKNKS